MPATPTRPTGAPPPPADAAAVALRPNWRILLYVPNLICYARLVLVAYGIYHCWDSPPAHTVLAFGLSILLDAVDGAAARALGQCSSIGTLLDVFADLVLRSACLCVAVARRLTPHMIVTAVFLIAWEWFVFVCASMHAGNQHWKELSMRAEEPWLVRTFFKNHFRNPIGAVGILGLFLLPMILMVEPMYPIVRSTPGYRWIFLSIVGGRLLAGAMEVYKVYRFLEVCLVPPEQLQAQQVARKRQRTPTKSPSRQRASSSGSNASGTESDATGDVGSATDGDDSDGSAVRGPALRRRRRRRSRAAR